jgi:hypothetical protein
MNRDNQREDAERSSAIEQIASQLDSVAYGMRPNWRRDMKETMTLAELRQVQEELRHVASPVEAITAINFSITAAKQARRREEDERLDHVENVGPLGVDF